MEEKTREETLQQPRPADALGGVVEEEIVADGFHINNNMDAVYA